MGSEEHKSLYELFREELTLQLAPLERALDGGPWQAPLDRRRLDNLVLAAHSMKGAARIVGAGLVDELCSAMEHLLTALRAGQAPATEAGHAALADAGRWLRALEPLEDELAMPWLRAEVNVASARALVARLNAARG